MKVKKVEDGCWRFRCPGCNGTHVVDQRWAFSGDLERPSFTPSILIHNGDGIPKYRCHSYVTAGKIMYLGDCTHSMVGTTVDMVDA